jgi:dipeptidase
VCTTIVVGKQRSATGQVIVAHSEELGRNSAHKVAVVDGRETAPGERFPLHSSGDIEQPARTARHLATKIFDKRHYPGEHTAGVNEHGVAVANNMAMMRGVPAERLYDVVPGGLIWSEFLQLVLERATTAREGAALVGQLCERHGLSCDSGTMIAVADPGEAWWVELARDGQWAARRVEDDEVSVRANCYRIGACAPGDERRLPGSPDLEAFAGERGWHTDGALDFAAAFGDPANQDDRYNLDRHEVLEARVSAMPTLGVPDLTTLLRDVYEGTPLYRARPDGSPFRTGVRTIARMNTEACTILEPRRHLAPGLGHRMWCCLSTSLTGVFVPFHLGVRRLEPHYATAGGRYSPDSAYWLFTELAKLVDYRYPACVDVVRDTWRAFEAETFRDLPAIESRCEGLPAAAAMDLVTGFDMDRAADAIRQLEALLVEVKTRAFHEDA